MGTPISAEKTIEFYRSPLGLRFELNTQDEYVHLVVGEITQRNESTVRVQEGWILKKVNGKEITKYSIQAILKFLSSGLSTVSSSNPVLLTFLSPTDTSPLFSPFLEKKADSQAIYVSDQKVAMVNSGAIRESITTLPSLEGAAAVPPSASQVEATETSLLNTTDIINVNDLRKRIINIDSEFREHLWQPPTDFSVKLAPIKNVIRIRMASVELSNTFYVFSRYRQNLSIRLICDLAGTDYTFTISPGNYTASGLVKAIQDQFDAAGLVPHYRISLSTITGHVTIQNDSSLIFTMDFRTENNEFKHVFWGLGYNIGFRSKYYSTMFSYTSESIIDVIVDQYLFLKVNNYNNVEQSLKSGGMFTAFAKLILKDGKYTKLFDDTANLLTKEIIFAQPTDISKFEIQLVDKYGEIVNNLDTDWSIAFEVTEVMNGRLYDFYRNYLFKRDSKL